MKIEKNFLGSRTSFRKNIFRNQNVLVFDPQESPLQTASCRPMKPSNPNPYKKIIEFLLFSAKRPALLTDSDDIKDYLFFINGFLVSQSSIFLGHSFEETRFTELFSNWIQEKCNRSDFLAKNLEYLCSSHSDFQNLVFAFSQEVLSIKPTEIDGADNLKI